MNVILQSVLERGDLAHLALFLWAAGASLLLAMTLRESAAANRRFDLFVRELARFNNRYEEETHDPDETRQYPPPFRPYKAKP